MSLLFTICAVVGGTLFVLQFLLSMLGFGGGHDVDAHSFDMHHAGGGQSEGTSWLFGMLSFRAVVAALTAFGLGGLAMLASGIPPLGSLGFAVFCAVVTMVIVAFMTHSMRKLEDDGTIQIQKALGRTGMVYLTIPANKSGNGKVTVSLQNRTMEFQAITPHEELATGTLVVVTAVIGSDTVEVTAAPHLTPTPETPR